MNHLRLTVLFFLFISTNIHAEDFKFTHFKLGPFLSERAILLEGQNQEVSNFKINPKEKSSSLKKSDSRLVQILKGEDETVESENQKSLQTGEESELPPLYRVLEDYLRGNYQTIGSTQVDSILHYNGQFGLGSQNYNGLVWEKPMGHFGIAVDRQLSPDLFNPNRWIVCDRLMIQVDASTFLNRLAEDGHISLSEQNLRAFAGIGYKRVYTSYHFANSYLEGLTSDFSKLFLPFLTFTPQKMMNLAPYENVTKEDFLSFNAGGIVTSPPWYGFSASAGVLVSFSRMAKVLAQSLGPDDMPQKNEFLRVTAEKTLSFATGISASLQVDLFKLLKLTLLSYDFEYSYNDTQSMHLSFYQQDKEKILAGGKETQEFKKILRVGISEVQVLKTNIVSYERRIKENLNSRYGVLLFAGIQKKDTEQIKLTKNGVTKTFFKHYFEATKLVQNFFARIFSAIMSTFDFNSNVLPDAQKTRSIVFEYDGTELLPHQTSKDDLILNSEEKLSLKFSTNYLARKTTGLLNKFYKKHTQDMLNSYTGISDTIKQALESDQLRGPLTVKATIRIEKDGLIYFNHLSENDVFYQLARTCDSKRPDKWRDESQRKKLLKRLQIGKEACVKTLGNKYLAYKRKFSERSEISFWKLRDFLINFFQKNHHKNDFVSFFGPDNVFFNGIFQATTNQGMPFQTFFHDGVFKGLGVIDEFKRSGTNNGVYTPPTYVE